MEGNVPKLEVLAALQCQLALGLALDTFQAQNDLLRGLRLLVEDGLGLATVASLLLVVPTLALGEEGGLALGGLGDLHLSVLLALLAEGTHGLGKGDLRGDGNAVSREGAAGGTRWMRVSATSSAAPPRRGGPRPPGAALGLSWPTGPPNPNP